MLPRDIPYRDYLPEGVTLKSDSLITIDVEVEATANN